MSKVKRGEIYYADLSPVVGSEQGGIRPVLILQNNVGNKHSTTTIVAPITSSLKKSNLPIHVFIENDIDGLEKDSFVLLEQIKTLDCRRLKEYVGQLDEKTLLEVDKALMISFGIDTNYK